MPEGFHDFARFITPDQLGETLSRHGLVVQELKGVSRTADGSRTLVDEMPVTYVGWALRTR